MLLANYNIHDLLTEPIETYLTDNDWTYHKLHNIIHKKSLIPEVHTKVVEVLTQAQTSNFIQIQKFIEFEVYKIQLHEDNLEYKKNTDELSKNEHIKATLTRNLNHIPTLISTYEIEIKVLQHTLNRIHQKAASHGRKVRTGEYAHLLTSIADYQFKIKTLQKSRSSLRLKLQETKVTINLILGRIGLINARAQAREVYLTIQEQIMDTLTHQYQIELKNKIQEQQKPLERKYQQLINDAESINFSFFLELLQKHLNAMQLNPEECDALLNSIKLIRQHMQHEHEALVAHDSATKQKQSLKTDQIKFNACKSKMHTLNTSIHELTNHNKELKSLNDDLILNLEATNTLRKNSAYTSLALMILTFLSMIPLLLVLSSALPFFMAPVLTYFLCSVVPLIFLIASVTTGISALNHRSKQQSIESDLHTNRQSLKANTVALETYTQERHKLEQETIPTLQEKIEKDEIAQEKLEQDFSKSHTLSQHFFAQATEVKPAPYSKPNTPASPKFFSPISSPTPTSPGSSLTYSSSPSTPSSQDSESVFETPYSEDNYELASDGFTI